MSTNKIQSEQTMTIGELSSITGLSASAIRFYQRKGLLPGRAGSSGWQRFDQSALDRLAVIELAKSGGFSLDEIIRLFDAAADPDSVPAGEPIWRGLAEAKILEIEAALYRLRHLRQLLMDALDHAQLSADRLSQVPGALGWTGPDPSELPGL